MSSLTSTSSPETSTPRSTRYVTMSWPSAGSMTLVRASLTLASLIIGSLLSSLASLALGFLSSSGEVPELGLLRGEVALAVGGGADPVRLLRVDDDARA